MCIRDRAYIDSLSAGDSAAKTAVDIALHDLVGTLFRLFTHHVGRINADGESCRGSLFLVQTPYLIPREMCIRDRSFPIQRVEGNGVGIHPSPCDQ